MIRISICISCCVATVCLALAAHLHGQSPTAGSASAVVEPAWPREAVADPTTLGFTRGGLDALDARMKQSVADGDTVGMTYILIRHGQVAAFRNLGQQTPEKPMALDSI